MTIHPSVSPTAPFLITKQTWVQTIIGHCASSCLYTNKNKRVQCNKASCSSSNIYGSYTACAQFEYWTGNRPFWPTVFLVHCKTSKDITTTSIHIPSTSLLTHNLTPSCYTGRDDGVTVTQDVPNKQFTDYSSKYKICWATSCHLCWIVVPTILFIF